MKTEVTPVKDAAVAANKAERIPVTAAVTLGQFRTDSGEDRTFIKSIIAQPFADEPDFVNLRIEPKWAAAKGLYEFYAKKELNHSESFAMAGEIRLASYYSKKKQKQVNYPALYMRNPFYPHGSEEIEFAVKRDEDAAVLSHLASLIFESELEAEAVERDDELSN